MHNSTSNFLQKLSPVEKLLKQNSIEDFIKEVHCRS